LCPDRFARVFRTVHLLEYFMKQWPCRHLLNPPLHGHMDREQEFAELLLHDWGGYAAIMFTKVKLLKC
jgi:hypothetical protein